MAGPEGTGGKAVMPANAPPNLLTRKCPGHPHPEPHHRTVNDPARVSARYGHAPVRRIPIGSRQAQGSPEAIHKWRVVPFSDLG
jgi:hypothetical protein